MYFGIFYDNPCSPLSFSLLPASRSPLQAHVLASSKDQERTCLFQITQSLEKHTKADIRADLQDQHQLLYKQYKNAALPAESKTRYLAIMAWWPSSRAQRSKV
jgi:hypothetical protein